MNILLVILSKLITHASDINDLTQALFSLIGGIFAISGIRYLHTLRKKKAEVTFGFWSQLLIRLSQLKMNLEQDNAIINNLFSDGCKKNWTSEGAPTSTDRIKDFQEMAKDTLAFLKTSSDQLPAYPGWTKDYLEIIQFLNEVLFYDISDSRNYFKYNEGGIASRKAVCEGICNKINKMINGIEKNQLVAEGMLCKKKS